MQNNFNKVNIEKITITFAFVIGDIKTFCNIYYAFIFIICERDFKHNE